MRNESSRPNLSTRGRIRRALVFGLFASLLLGLGTAAHGQPSATSGDGDLELRGYTRIGNDHAFSIRNTQTGESEWVWAGEPGEYFSIEGFDPEKQVLTVRYQNRVSTVTLQRARIDHTNAPVTATLPSFEPPTPPPGRISRDLAATRETSRRAPGTAERARPSAGDGTAGDGARGDPPSGGGFIPGGFPRSGGGSDTPPETPSPPPAGDEDDFPDDEDDDSWDSIGPPPPPPDTPPPSYTPST